jgi:hypothetical protein
VLRGTAKIRIVLPDSDRDWHPGLADPDPADADRYLMRKEKRSKLA